MSFFQQILFFFTDTTNPVLRLLQIVLLVIGVLAAFLVFFTTRDVLLRSRSFAFQFFSIVLVAVIPVIGFLVYLLIRPARTIKDREMEARLKQIFDRLLGEPTPPTPILIAPAHSPHADAKKEGKSSKKDGEAH